MPTFTRAGQLLAGSALLLAGLAQATPAIDWDAFNARTVSDHILPRYQQFAQHSQVLADTTVRWCESRSSSDFGAVQQAFDNSLQAWQGVQHLQFGPVQLLMRNYGIQFWPDRKGITGRQLKEALQGPDSGSYDAEFFRHASVSIKGYPALERLFYDEGALHSLQNEANACALASAISTQLAHTAQAILDEWQAEPRTGQGSEDGEDTIAGLPELSLELLRSLVQPVEMIRDNKLERVLGKDMASARLQRAENWRSGQSLQSIVTNLAALQELYGAGEPSLDQILRQQGAADQADQISGLFSQAQSQLEALPENFAPALQDTDAYEQLKALSRTLKALDIALYDAMPAINAQLGFNSRDGD
ncbi:imelysin family protein [Marinobacterium rhizophilum]|uniref:Imelysin family protein n=1 Tax=Marinobacterium rhizophilum TaxID=420402 RepID=A0ABY5HHI4_9GAMM|nr:imelysin family protein [Marinobacterium rhizophilum]UTW10757.1 imelysin family protein [Marinobacterium rhizophilum]